MEGDLTDRLIEDFDNRKSLQEDAHSIRGYKVIHNTNMSLQLMEEYNKVLLSVLGEYQKLYPHSTETIEAFTLSKTFNIQKYPRGRHYSAWHCENNGTPPFQNRHLAFMTYLNTAYQGGETEFLHQNLKIKPEKGLTLFWPAHFTHIHRGLPSHVTEKYITTGWFEFFNTEKFLSLQEDVGELEFYNNLDNLSNNIR